MSNQAVRVPMIDENAATDRLQELYQELKSATGLNFVPDMFRLMSTRPEFLDAIFRGYWAVFSGGLLPRQTKELIAAWTSRVNECSYCVGTHNFFLHVFGASSELTDAVATSHTVDALPINDRERALLTLLTKVTTSPQNISDEEWAATLDAGWSTDELLEGIFTTVLFNAITRLVDSTGLGASVAQSRAATLGGNSN